MKRIYTQHMYTHTYTRTYIHAYLSHHMRTYTHTHMYTRAHIHILHAHIHAYIHHMILINTENMRTQTYIRTPHDTHIHTPRANKSVFDIYIYIHYFF